MSLYRVRLFRLMEEDKNMGLYEAYTVGTIIASNGIFNCKEYLYKGKIPIVDRRKDYACQTGEHVGSYQIHLTPNIIKIGYIVLDEDFSKKNKMSKKDLIKNDPLLYASMAMKLLKAEQTPFKRLLKTRNGVVYGRDIKDC